MNKIFNIIDKPSREGMPRNGFSLDHSRQFALNAGEIHCPTQIDVVPGDNVKMEASAFFRAMTLNSAAFASCKVLVDWYFVPYTQLWTLFDNFLTQRDTDKWSSALQSSLHQPYIYLRQLIQGLFVCKYWDSYTGSVPSPLPTGVILKDRFAFASYDRALQLIDELGYGNYFPLYDWFATELDKKNNSQTYDTSIDDGSFIPDIKVAIWRVLAYQKIYNAYYRDSEIDVPLNNSLFNADFCTCSSETNADYGYMIGVNDMSTLIQYYLDNTYYNQGLFGMRYRKWQRDIFTSTQPSTQFGSVSTVPISLTGISGSTGSDVGKWSTVLDSAQYINNNDAVTLRVNDDNTYNLKGSQAGFGIKHTHDFSSVSGVSSFSVLLQKYAEAMQEWRQNALRAGNRMKDNMKAHYGFEPYYHNDTEPVHLQSWEFSMQPTDVTSTADTGSSANQPLGSTTGKLVGGSTFNKPVQFAARDFGVIMCMVTVVPQCGYDSYMLDKLNTKGSSPYDYFTPEFDNIGLEPITYSQLNFAANKGSMAKMNESLGYHARFSEYKYMISKSFHLFEHSHISGSSNGPFSSYVTNRFDMQGSNFNITPATSSNFSKVFRYINPNCLASIFVQAQSTIEEPQFICTFGFFGTKVSNMSLIGMPRF